MNLLKDDSCSIGIIADPQYCDCDTIVDPNPSVASGHTYRHFRSDTNVTKAATAWEKHCGIKHVLQLGDLIDSRNSKKGDPVQAKASAVALMRQSLRDFRPSPSPWVVHHLIGNNEVANFTREELKAFIDPPFYHTFVPKSGWRVIVLDMYAVSTLGPYPPELGEEAKEMLLKNNPNFKRLNVDMNSSFSDFGYKGENYNPSEGLCDQFNEDSRWRFVDYNGALGSEQHHWLKTVLSLAEKENENVIVAGHTPIHSLVSNHLDSLSWDCEEIMETLNASNNVVLYIAGHDHQGGYYFDDKSGIHHLTVPSPLTARPGTGSRFLIAKLMDNGVIGLKGEGFVQIDPGVGLVGGNSGEKKERKKDILKFAMDKDFILKRGSSGRGSGGAGESESGESGDSGDSGESGSGGGGGGAGGGGGTEKSLVTPSSKSTTTTTTTNTNTATTTKTSSLFPKREI
jgi:manganese-dependent ADP-ribose/CDP-alcohol diphosphatase